VLLWPGGGESASFDDKKDGHNRPSPKVFLDLPINPYVGRPVRDSRSPMSGEVVHFEIPTDNAERARKFYSSVFGWKMQTMEEMHYTMVSTTATDKDGRPKEPGAINGGIASRKSPLEHPTVTINVDEIDKALQSVEKNGGKILQKKTPIGDGSMGFTGYFKDSEGNVIGLYQMGTG
jgi:uncharacterized protein